MARPRLYQTFKWRGRTTRRKIPSAAATRARVKKMIATKAAAKAAKAAKRAPPRAAVDQAPAAAHRRARSNGSAAPREPDIEGAVICLTRAENWMSAAKYMGLIREYDPAHREVVAALGALLGLSAP